MSGESASPVTKRLGILLAATLSCGGGSTTAPFREPSIAFDQATYTVTLNAAATAVVSKPTPIVTVTRGTDAIGPILFLALDPAGYCNVGPGVGFSSSSVQKSIQGSEATVSQGVDFNVCPAVTGAQTIPKGNTSIRAILSQAGKSYTAIAVVTVQ